MSATVHANRPARDARAPAASDGYRPHLDGIRAVAVVAVILFHLGYGWIPGGFVGVDVFFVLSGYLITGILLGEVGRTGTLRLRRFYARRARRLLPASIAVLVAVMAAGLLVLDRVQQRSLGWDATWAALYSANWRFAFDGGEYFAPGDVPSPLVHYWSLAVEEQFYLVWPAVLLVLHRLARRAGERAPAVLVAMIGALTGASLVTSLVLTGDPIGYYGTHARAYQLLAGALLAAALRWRPVRLEASTRSHVGAAFVAVAALVVLGVQAHTLADAVDYPGTPAIWVTLASLALIAALDLVPTGPAARLAGVGPAAAVGRLSYSLYIWHWPIIVLLPPLAARWGWSPSWDAPVRLALVTVVVALGSYLLVERPVRFRLVPSARPGFVIALGLAASVLTGAVAVPLFQPRSDFDRKVLDAAEDRPAERGCPYEVSSWPDDPSSAEPCVYRSGAPGAPVVAVVGDSHAQGWLPAVERLVADDDATIVTATREGCPPVDLTPYLRNETNQIRVQDDCTAWRHAVYPKVVEDFDPDVILVGHRSQVRSYEVDGVAVPARRPGHLEAWSEGWSWTFDTLTAGRATVAVTTILPTMPWRVPACLAEAGEDEGCDAPAERDRWVEPYNQAIADLAATTDGRVRVVDAVPIACPAGVCQAMLDGEVVRRDDNHLTASFARSQADELADALDEVRVRL